MSSTVLGDIVLQEVEQLSKYSLGNLPAGCGKISFHKNDLTNGTQKRHGAQQKNIQEEAMPLKTHDFGRFSSFQIFVLFLCHFMEINWFYSS